MKIIGLGVKTRLIIICILIGTIPAIIVGIFSFYRDSKTIQTKVNEGNMRNLVQIKMSAEQLLRTADQVMSQFIDTPAIISIMDIDMKGNEFEIFNNAEEAINNLPTTVLGTSEISFANFVNSWVINNRGIHRLKDYPESVILYQLAKIAGSSFWIDELSMDIPDKSVDGVLFDRICLVKKLPIFYPNPTHIAVLKISHSIFVNLISKNENLGEVMIIGDNGRIIAHHDRNQWGMDYTSAVYFKKLVETGKDSGTFNIRMDNVDYSINYLISDYNNWIYLSKTSLADVTKDSKAIGWFTLLACLAVIALVNIAAFTITSRVYKPIGKLYSLLVGIKEQKENLNKQDEFVLIEERVNFLLKDYDRLNNQVSNQFENLKEFFIFKLILSEIDQNAIESKIKLYGYPVLTDFISVLVVSIDTFEGTKYEENDKDLMLYAINNIAGELLDEMIVLKPVVIDEYQVTIIRCSGCRYEDIKDYVFGAAEKIQETVENMLRFTVSIGISQPLHSYKDIHKGYIEGIEALKYQISLGYKAIILYQDIKNISGMKLVFPEKLEKELIDAIKICSFNNAKELLHQIIGRIFAIEASRYEYQVSTIKLLNDLVFILIESGKSHNILIRDGKSVFEQLLALKTPGEIESWFTGAIIQPVIHYLESSEKKQYKKIVDDVLKIIHEDFHTELTLEDCAARLNYHPSYIRRILKNESGIVFSDYLGQYRMDVAKMWLIETDMKIVEIAKKLNYKKPENFIRSFKKITGMTPGNYREINKENS